MAPASEHWLAYVIEPGEAGPSWMRSVRGWTTCRSEAAQWAKPELARKEYRRGKTCGRLHLIHVTVWPTGQRAAWERVVRAAERWATYWGVRVSRGEHQQHTRDLLYAVRALGQHRPNP